MKRIMVKSILLGLLFLPPQIAHAGGVFIGKITRIMSGPDYGTKVLIAVDGTVSDAPSCANNPTWSFAFDSDQPGGKVWLSIAELAYTTQAEVRLSGRGECLVYTGIESMSAIHAR